MFIIALVVFAALEATWLWTMRGFYARQLGSLGFGKIQSIPAVIMVYALIAAALLYFVLLPARYESRPKAILRGALFGASVYGVYNLTNMATLPGYSWTMVAVDTLWGATLFAVAAALAHL